MGIARVTIGLQRRSGIPADVVQNVWHFGGAGALSDEMAGDIGSAVVTFYQGLATYIGNQITRTGQPISCKVAAVNAGSPGENDDTIDSPLYTSTGTLGASSGTGTTLPSECAIALSYHGDLTSLPVQTGSIRPRSRHMGRLFLGPLSNQAVDTDATLFEQRPGAAFKTAVFAGIDTLVASVFADTGWDWGVYSRANATLYPAVSCYIDNAVDIIRSRGDKPTGRTTHALA